MNHQSSRSHTLFRLHVESVSTSMGPDGTNVIKESVLVRNNYENHSFVRTLLILLAVRKYQIIPQQQLTMAVFMAKVQVLL